MRYELKQPQLFPIKFILLISITSYSEKKQVLEKADCLSLNLPKEDFGENVINKIFIPVYQRFPISDNFSSAQVSICLILSPKPGLIIQKEGCAKYYESRERESGIHYT